MNSYLLLVGEFRKLKLYAIEISLKARECKYFFVTIECAFVRQGRANR